jgi:hypothetical protein
MLYSHPVRCRSRILRSACARAHHTLSTSPCVVLVTAYTAAKAPVWGAADETCPPL